MKGRGQRAFSRIRVACLTLGCTNSLGRVVGAVLVVVAGSVLLGVGNG